MKLKTGNLTFIDLLWISINNVPVLGPFLLTPFLPPSTVLVLRGLTLRVKGLRLHHHLLPARSGQWDGPPQTELLTSDTSCLGNTPSSPPPPTQGRGRALPLSTSSLPLIWSLGLSITCLAPFWYCFEKLVECFGFHLPVKTLTVYTIHKHTHM